MKNVGSKSRVVRPPAGRHTVLLGGRLSSRAAKSCQVRHFLQESEIQKDDTDDEPEDQELEAHYLYMAQIQEVTSYAADNSGPIFDAEPLQKADHDNNDLARERNLLASLVEKLKCEIDDIKNCNKFLESSNQTLVDKLKSEIECFKNKIKCLESSNNHYKEANTKLAKNNQLMFKDCWEIYCKRLNTGSITVKSGRIS
ncbi:hypothetical protein Tco_0885847 [Tanacetum coccineum]